MHVSVFFFSINQITYSVHWTVFLTEACMLPIQQEV